jgi:hypothetical protein
MQIVVKNLFDVLDVSRKNKGSSAKSPEECLKDFHDYLIQLKTIHVKKNYLPSFLVGWLFSERKEFKNDTEVAGYCRAQLCVAEHCFGEIIAEIANTSNRDSAHGVKQFEPMIHNFIHDLRPIIEFLEKRRDPAYTFFDGGKFHGTRTIDAFKISNNLFWTNAFSNNFVDMRVGLNLSVFTLRQSLELKYRRILGVGGMYNKDTENEPKLRHDYFYSFIKANMSHFNFHTPQIADIWKIYRWTNSTIHTGNIPRLWELQFALKVVNPFFAPQPASHTGAWSIHSSVEIIDHKILQDKFKVVFHVRHPESDWVVEFEKPEAVIKS